MSTPTNTIDGDGTLAHAAASGDRVALADLVSRYGSPAWGLGRLLSPASAEAVVAEGFAAAIRRLEGRGRVDALRPAVFSGVYRAGLAETRQTGAQARSPLGDPTPDRGPVIDAVLTLPERWRAALWLREVDGIDAAGIAAVIGVSASAAGHMVERASQTLSLRLGGAVEAGGLATALTRWTGPVPDGLAGSIGAALTDGPRAGRPVLSALAGGRMSERTQRSVAIVAGGVIAVSVIGIGVLGQGFGVHGSSSVANPSGPGATGTILAAPASKSVPAPTAHHAPAGTSRTTSGGAASSGSGAGTTSTGSHHRIAGRSGGSGSEGSTTNSGGATSGGSTSNSGAGSGGSTATTAGGGVVSTPTVPVTTPPAVTTQPTTSTTVHVSVPGVISVGSGGGTTSVTVGSSTNPAASATVCQNGVEINALGLVVGSCPSSAAPTTTTTAPSGLGGLGL